MSSPNEPGNGNAPGPGGPRPTGAAPVSTGARPQQPPQAPPPPPPRRTESSGPHGTSGIEERINRFISGPSAGAPAVEPDAAVPAARPEAPAPSEPIRSELPDLSGPTPRPVRTKPPVERASAEPSSSRSTATGTASRVQVGTRTSGPVRASMQIRRVDPWSVLKVSLVLSVAAFFVWMIAVAFLYLVLGGMGVWAKLNSNVGDLLNNTASNELVSSGTIFGGAALIGLVNIVLLTAMATVGAFIYNLTTDLVGGVEVTLADRD
ncbi:MAG: DUF3566 domain-containing protein [Candidatus Sericytochromatia bacterium]